MLYIIYHVILPPCWDSVWLESMQALHIHNCCELNSYVQLTVYGSYSLSSSSFTMIPEPWVCNTNIRATHSSGLYFLHFEQILSVTIYFKMNLLWWDLTDSLSYEYNDKLFVSLIFYPLNSKSSSFSFSVFDFSRREFWSQWLVLKCRFQLVWQALSPTNWNAVGYCHDAGATTTPVNYWTSEHVLPGQLWLTRFLMESGWWLLFSLALCIALSSSLKANNRDEASRQVPAWLLHVCGSSMRRLQHLKNKEER